MSADPLVVEETTLTANLPDLGQMVPSITFKKTL